MPKLFSHRNITGKYHGQLATLPMSMNPGCPENPIVVRIPVSRNRKYPRFLRFLVQVGTMLKGKYISLSQLTYKMCNE